MRSGKIIFLSLLLGQILSGSLLANSSTSWDVNALRQAFSNTKNVEFAFLGDVRTGEVMYFGQSEMIPGLEAGRFGFPLASNGKLLIAEAVLQLVDAGKLDLKAPISEFLDGSYLPDNPYSDISPLTPEHLLRHTSGLDETHFSQYVLDDSGFDLRQFIRSTPGYRCRWVPGSRFAYSNTNYDLLALLLEEFSGVPWSLYLQSQFEKNTLDFGIATPYLSPDYSGAHRPASSAVIAPKEFIQLLRGLFLADSASSSSVSARLEADLRMRIPGQYMYGYRTGWQKGISYIYHTGEIGPFRSRFEMFPDIPEAGHFFMGLKVEEGYVQGNPFYREVRRQAIKGLKPHAFPLSASSSPTILPPEGCYLPVNPRNEILGWYDRYFLSQQLQHLDAETIRLGEIELVAAGNGYFRLPSHQYFIARSEIDAVGVARLTLGIRTYKNCACWKPGMIQSMRQLFHWLAAGLFLLGLVMWLRKYRYWAVLLLYALPIVLTEIGFLILTRTDPHVLGVPSLNSALLLATTSLIPILLFGNFVALWNAGRKGRGRLMVALFALFLVNGALTYGLISTRLVFFISWLY